MRLSLHQLTVQDVTPEKLVEIAAAQGCGRICLFLQGPGNPVPFPNVVDLAQARALARRLKDAGVRASNCGTVFLTPGQDIAVYGPFLDIAAELGGETLNILSGEPDVGAAAAQLHALAELAKPLGLVPAFEWFRNSEVRTLPQALELVGRAEHPDVGLNADILHLIRNGGVPADLAPVDPALITYAQICDGPLVLDEEAQQDEAGKNRNFPGSGEFPLVDFVQNLPADIVLSIEAPVNRMMDQLSPVERATRAIEGTRAVLKAAGIAETVG